MAYVDPINQDDDKEQSNQEIATTPETSIISGGAGASQASGKGGGAKGWTNLQTYVDANKEQSGKLGQDVSKDISNKINTIDTQKEQYSNTYSQARPTINMEADQSILSDISKGNISPRKNEIASVYNAQYKGPASTQAIQGYEDIAKGYSDTGVRADNLNSEQGRVEALQSTYGKQQPYTSGEQYLDSFILGAGEQGRKALQDTQNLVSGSKNAWKKTLADVAADIDANRSYYNALRGQAQQAVGSKLGEYSDVFNAQKQQLNQESAAKAAGLAALQDALKNNRSAAYDQLGLDRATGDFLAKQGFDFNSLYKASGDRALGDIADKGKIDSYSILSEIAGQGPQFDFNKTGNSASAFNVDSSKASQAQEAKRLNDLIQQRVAAEQAKRDASLATAMSYTTLPKTASEAEIIDGARTLGISADEYRRALNNNIDLAKFVRAGKKLQVGDVATQAERGQWDSLRSALGLGAAPSFEDTQDEGNAYNVEDLIAAIRSLPTAEGRDQRPIPQVGVVDLSTSNVPDLSQVRYDNRSAFPGIDLGQGRLGQVGIYR